MSDVAPAVAGPTAGALLRRAREASGLHVAALAVSLKVPVRKLEALEDDRWDQLPDAVFARALASSVCRSLKIDPQPVLERLPQGSTPRLTPDHEGINAPFRAPGDVVVPAWRDHLTRPVSLAVGALLLGALVLVFMPSRPPEEAPVARAEPAGAPMASPVLLQPVPSQADGLPGAPAAGSGNTAPPAGAAMPTPPPAAAAVTAPAPAAPAALSTVATTAPPAAAAPALPASSAPSAAANGIVFFRAKGPSWVQVTDAAGTVTLRRLLATGEAVGASGTLPLSVTVGSASATAVEVRGKAYDLAPVSRDNVARFEVK
jgi:cytoskeleton protein RodZ